MTWSVDDGVEESFDNNLGLYIEHFSNDVLTKKVEWDAGIGFMKIA